MAFQVSEQKHHIRLDDGPSDTHAHNHFDRID